MNSMQFWKTATTPSSFGMPISGAAFGAFTPATDAVRERAAIAATQGAVKAHVGLAPSQLPGTTAWRPPTC